jgi:hypothetical protein
MFPSVRGAEEPNHSNQQQQQQHEGGGKAPFPWRSQGIKTASTPSPYSASGGGLAQSSSSAKGLHLTKTIQGAGGSGSGFSQPQPLSSLVGANPQKKSMSSASTAWTARQDPHPTRGKPTKAIASYDHKWTNM